MIKKLILSILLITNILYSKTTGDKQMKSILQSQPYYTLDIKKEDVKVFITLNGETIYKSYNKRNVHLAMPVNQWMQSGENKIEVKLLASKRDDLTITKDAYVKVSLNVTSNSNSKMPMETLNTIVFANLESNATKEGIYDSKNEFKESNEGDVKISKFTTKILDEYRTTEHCKGYVLSQSVNVDVPFPRWKFLDSEYIYEGNFYNITMEEYKKLFNTEKIQAFYKIHKKISDAIANNELESVMPYFKERSDEMDIAMYREKGYTLKDLFKSFKKTIDNPNAKVFAFDKRMFFYISEGAKTIQVPQGLIFNFKSTSINYPIIWRYQNGQWIITR